MTIRIISRMWDNYAMDGMGRGYSDFKIQKSDEGKRKS